MGFELSFELTVQSTPRALNLLKFLGYFHCFCVAKRTRAPSPVARIHLGCQGQGSAASDAVPAVGVAAAFWSPCAAHGAARGIRLSAGRVVDYVDNRCTVNGRGESDALLDKRGLKRVRRDLTATSGCCVGLSLPPLTQNYNVPRYSPAMA
jgi:hypothetical protein